MSKAIAKTESSALPSVLVTGFGHMQAALQENLGPGDRIGPRDLTVLKTPTGGGTSWEVETLDGTESVRTITGVVIAKRKVRAYWPARLGQGGAGGAGAPPACVSLDSVIGVGDPGGDCAVCPFAQFGSAVRDDGTAGRGQACKQSEELFIATAEQPLPMVVRVSAASLDRIRKFWLLMAQSSKPYYHAMLNVSLEKATNKDNITYAQVALALNRWLEGDEVAQATAAHQSFAAIMGLVGSLHDDGDAESV